MRLPRERERRHPFPPDIPLKRSAKARSVFFGTSSFAVPSLDAMARSTDCTLVITQPDRPAGRGRRMTPTPVKARAHELGIATAEPLRLRDAVALLEDADARIFTVASYGKILPQAVLDMPPLGALNVHPSVLPLYRGATPLQSQIRDGVTSSGVTIIVMDAGMDTGDIVLQTAAPIAEFETYGDVHDRFADAGAQLLERAVALALEGRLERVAQRDVETADAQRTVTRPLMKSDLEIDWSWSAQRIYDCVRSLAPAPLARARFPSLDGLVKIAAANLLPRAGAGALIVPCGSGEQIAIERVIPPNRSAMSGFDFERSLARIP